MRGLLIGSVLGLALWAVVVGVAILVYRWLT